MGIPIYIGRRFIDQTLPPVTRPCQSCQTVMLHHVVRHYITVSVYALPFLGRTLEIRYRCSHCGMTTTGPAPAGAPSIPFLHRMGCLIFMGLPAVVGIGYLVVDHYQVERRHEQWLAEQHAKEEAVTLAKTAKAEAEASKKKCFAVVDDVLNTSTSRTKVLDLKDMPPADPSKLEGAAYVVVKHALEINIPRPAGKYFGASPCAADVSKLVSDTSYNLTGGEGFSAEAAKAEAQALLDKARALTPPAMIVVTDYTCPTKTKICTGVAAWISMADKKVVAVVHTEKSMDHLGYQADADGLAPGLQAAVGKW